MSALSPLNIVISEDPLLSQEACDQIIAAAKAAGVEQREIFDVADKFNWDELAAASQSMSLFGELKLTDIRFTKVPNKEAQTALVEIVESAGQDDFYLIRLPKLEKRQKSTKWFKALSANAKLQELWPPKPHEHPGWINQRAAKLGLGLEPDASQLLAEQTEGNLLAADQMLRKLKLLYPTQKVDRQAVEGMISDNAKYSVFLCLDEALSGKGERAVRMLHKFKQEGVAPISILVNLSREVGLCHSVATGLSKGQSVEQTLAKSFLWDSKKRLLGTAARRLPLPLWQRLAVRCAFLDRMVKGQEQGDIWRELESCLWLISGQRIWGGR